MTKVMAILACVAWGVALQAATFMLGWGLTPRSWAWIIGLSLIGQGSYHFVIRKVLEEK